MPSNVAEELFINLLLLPLCEADLTRTWLELSALATRRTRSGMELALRLAVSIWRDRLDVSGRSEAIMSGFTETPTAMAMMRLSGPALGYPSAWSQQPGFQDSSLCAPSACGPLRDFGGRGAVFAAALALAQHFQTRSPSGGPHRCKNRIGRRIERAFVEHGAAARNASLVRTDAGRRSSRQVCVCSERCQFYGVLSCGVPT